MVAAETGRKLGLLGFNLIGVGSNIVAGAAGRGGGGSSANVDEARYNLATRVMSNGVEVIVAGDKSTLPGEPNVSRILPSTHYKPVTLTPSVLLGDHMLTVTPFEVSFVLSKKGP